MIRPRLSSLLLLAALSGALSCALSGAATAQDFSKVQVKSEKLNDTTYMLIGAGGNLAVAFGPDAVFVVDDQYAPMTPKLKAAIAALTSEPVKFVLNTHWHGDHTGGNENFGKAGATIVAHENVRKRMSSDQLIAFFSKPVKASPKQALPVVTFGRDVTFHLNGDEIHVFHVPNGHTDGDAIVHFKNGNIMHLGDLFFNKSYPFIDISSGGSVAGVIAAADQALALANEDTKIIPGHGPLAGRADLQAYRDLLRTVAAKLMAHKRDGRTLAEVVAAKPSAEFDALWGKGFITPDAFVTMLWQDINRK
ncbi:MBL fold metallo-hydrolase [Massilia glaciei]|uniref:beta-lactamase n=2 Tax=Massilia glaciei TaxID=1524097 RepID=A0A2U2HGY0_9BURK|nr:MBL fold metallo-hydrolase [Massilia glaciei]